MLKPTKLKKTSLATTIAAISAVGAIGASSASFAQQTNMLEEVVVTAQFVEQNLQETPVAITAITVRQLEARGHNTVDDIAAQAPNVTLTEGGGYSGPSLIGFIRGVGQTDFNPALEPGVGLYVDDVYYSQLSGSVLELLDLQRVEVLRGPQGTLAGKNSIGGAIKLYSKRPDGDSNGYVETGYGDFNSVSVRAGTNITVADDKLYARISGVSRSRDGYVDRLDYNCANPDNQIAGLESYIQDATCKTGADGSTDYTGARLALRWLASDDLEMNLSTEKVKNKLGAPPSVLVGTYGTTDTAPNRAAWNEYRERFVPEEGEYITYGTYVDSRSNLVIQDEMRVDSSGTALNIDWQLSDTLELESITGIREFETAFGTDLDQSPIPILQQYQVLTHKQKSQEIRLNGKAGDLLEYTVGAFYFDAHTELAGRIDLGYSTAELDFLHGPDPVDVLNTAVFANTIIHPTDTIDITLGVRYSTDEKAYTYRRRNPDLSDVEPCTGPPGSPGVPTNCVLNGLDGLQPDKYEDERTDYRLAAGWRPVDDTMLYYQFSTGFKGGGVNPRPFYTPQASPFQPEELATHEVGAKWQGLGDTLRINVAYFMNDYEGVQLTLLDCTAYFPGFGVPCLAPKNSGDADVTGFELELDFNPIDDWLLEASFSTLDFEYTNIDPATGLTGEEVTPFTPELTWSFSTQYDFNTGIGTISPRIDAHYQDEVQTAAGITEYGTIEERTLVNASITLLSSEEDWQARIEIRNLTDEYYYTNITDAPSSLHAYALVGMPRTWNLTVKHMF